MNATQKKYHRMEAKIEFENLACYEDHKKYLGNLADILVEKGYKPLVYSFSKNGARKCQILIVPINIVKTKEPNKNFAVDFYEGFNIKYATKTNNLFMFLESLRIKYTK